MKTLTYNHDTANPLFSALLFQTLPELIHTVDVAEINNSHLLISLNSVPVLTVTVFVYTDTNFTRFYRIGPSQTAPKLSLLDALSQAINQALNIEYVGIDRF